MVLLTNRDRSRFFLAPDAAALGAGDLELQSMAGDTVRVAADAAAGFEVPEAVARAWAEQHVGELTAALSAARAQFDQMSAEARRQIAELSARGGLRNPDAILATLGVDPRAAPDELVRQLGDLVSRLAGALPDAARGLVALRDQLPLGPEPGASVGAVFAGVARDPDADPQLREAAAKLEALARKLDEPGGGGRQD